MRHFWCLALCCTLSLLGYAEELWRPIDLGDLYIQSGSALDLSRSDIGEAGSRGRIIINADGHPAPEMTPDQPIRFFCAALIPAAPVLRLQNFDHAALDRFADSVARQGYNMVRFHYWDVWMMGVYHLPEAKSAEPLPKVVTPDEIRFDPERLDKFHYLVAALKKRGIYLYLDALSSPVGFFNVNPGPYGFYNAQNARIRLLVDPDYRANWSAGVTKLLTAPNPYTGMTLAEDPVLAVLLFCNEQDIRLDLNRAIPGVLRERWHEWYSLRHPGEAVPELGFREYSSGSATGNEMSRFLSSLTLELNEFYRETIRKIGYRGIVTQWDMTPSLLHLPARAQMDAVSMHAYFDHPAGFDGPGSSIRQSCSIAESGGAFRQLAAARLAGKPFFVMEYGCCFWNRFRHEQGLLYGAGAALQDWDALTLHGQQVMPRANYYLKPFDAGADPINRASEVVAALLFGRRMASAAATLIEIPVSDDYIFNGHASGAAGLEWSPLALISRIALRYPAGQPARTPFQAEPGGIAMISSGTMSAEAIGSFETASAEELASRLPGDAKMTDGCFVSETGELRLDSGRGTLEVVTPSLAGAVFREAGTRELGDFITVRECSGNAALTVAAVDDRILPESRRLLVVFATDARNSRMTFRDAEEKILESHGELPVVVRSGKFSLRGESRNGSVPRAYALKLNGERMTELPIEWEEPHWTLTINTAELQPEIALFFEVVWEK